MALSNGILFTAAGVVVLALLFALLLSGRSRRRMARLQAEQDEANRTLTEELKRLQSVQAQLIHSGKMASLGKMIAGITHEINTPLGFVKSNVDIVKDLLSEYDALVQRYARDVDAYLRDGHGEQGESRRQLLHSHRSFRDENRLGEIPQLLDDAVEGLEQISALVRTLKDFSRLDREGTDLLNVRAALDNALMIAEHLVTEGVQVYKRYAAVPGIRCVPSQINQVFLNLISNALQAMEGKGKLILSTRALNGYVEVTIADTGPGIPKEVLPKIFDPFFTTKDVGQGAGLGLSIVDRIVKAHDGRIRVRTAPQKGTQFTVMLPIGAQEAPAVAPPGEKAEAAVAGAVH